MPFEEKLGVTREIIRYLNELRYPYLILTKSASVASFDVDPELAYVQFSVSTGDDGWARRLEPGADPPSARLRAMRAVADRGVYCALRINPMLPWYPDGTLESGGDSDGKLNWWDLELIDAGVEAGAGTILAGFLRLDPRTLRWTSEAAGIDLRPWFRGKFVNSSLHYSAAEKRIYYEMVAERTRQAGAEFSVCYDGDDAYNEFRYLWADQEDCCNGRRNIPAFGATVVEFAPTS